MRVLTLLEILQAREAVSGAELAARLEVDLRTVQRYITRLRDLKIPVEASRGVGGAYRLRAGFRLPPLLLTNEEAFALLTGAGPSAAMPRVPLMSRPAVRARGRLLARHRDP